MKEQIINTPWDLIIATITAIFGGGGVILWRKKTDKDIEAQKLSDAKMSKEIEIQRLADDKMTKALHDMEIKFLEHSKADQEKFIRDITTMFSNVLLQMTQSQNSTTHAILEMTKVLTENQKDYKESIERVHHRITDHETDNKSDFEKVKDAFVHKDHCNSKMSSKLDKG